MKRRKLRICLFLLLGAILNIAVAWGAMVHRPEVSPTPEDCTCAWRPAPRRVGVVETRWFEAWVPVEEERAVVREGRIASEKDRHGQSETVIYFTGYDSGATWIDPVVIADSGPDWYESRRSADVGMVVRYTSGWPMRSLRGFIIVSSQSTWPAPPDRWSEWVIDVSGRGGFDGPLPLRPLWPGFLINTVFFAGISWVLFAAAGRAHRFRRWRRLSRGLCPKCAYPIGESDVCSECGTVRPRGVAMGRWEQLCNDVVKRWVVRGCLLLLLGAILNIAVSWGCSLSAVGEGRYMYYHDPEWDDQPVVFMREYPGYATITGVDRPGALLSDAPEWLTAYRGRRWWRDEAVERYTNNYAMACGWPLFALTAWRTVDGEDEMRFPGDIHGGVLVQAILGDQVSGDVDDAPPAIIALQPLWPGFALNTLFYAAILWVLWFVPRAVRRTLRRRRGLCPACAYPIGEGDVCSECGAPRHVTRP